MRRFSLLHFYYPLFFEKASFNYKMIVFSGQNIFKKLGAVYKLPFFVERNGYSVFFFLSRALILKRYFLEVKNFLFRELMFGRSFFLSFSGKESLQRFFFEIEKFSKEIFFLGLFFGGEFITKSSCFFFLNFSLCASFKKIFKDYKNLVTNSLQRICNKILIVFKNFFERILSFHRRIQKIFLMK